MWSKWAIGVVFGKAGLMRWGHGTRWSECLGGGGAIRAPLRWVVLWWLVEQLGFMGRWFCAGRRLSEVGRDDR